MAIMMDENVGEWKSGRLLITDGLFWQPEVHEVFHISSHLMGFTI